MIHFVDEGSERDETHQSPSKKRRRSGDEAGSVARVIRRKETYVDLCGDEEHFLDKSIVIDAQVLFFSK